jgi:hypothetical protein
MIGQVQKNCNFFQSTTVFYNNFTIQKNTKKYAQRQHLLTNTASGRPLYSQSFRYITKHLHTSNTAAFDRLLYLNRLPMNTKHENVCAKQTSSC